MLARERAAKLQNEIGDVVGDRFEHTDARVRFHVDHRPHVQASHRRMGVHAGRRAVPLDDALEPLDVIAQLFGRDGGVLHE